jgi:hypothetical protein
LAKLTEIAVDVRQGLLETVGVDSEFSTNNGRCSIMLKLSVETDTKTIAEAIALENADAWCDKFGQVHLGISPFYSIKDVDQSVLSAIKVIHVLLGLHAVCEVKPKNFAQKLLHSLTDIMKIQKQANGK